MAILLYKQGVRELEKAVSLNIDPNGNLLRYLFLFIFVIDRQSCGGTAWQDA